MCFLVRDVFAYSIDLTSRIRKDAKAFLPIEMSTNPSLPIDEIRRSRFNIPNQIGNPYRWLYAHEDMHMIRHAKDRKQLLPAIGYDAGNVFVQFFSVLGMY